MWVTIFRGSTVIGIIALLILLVNIANGAFGYALIEYEVSPKELANGGIVIECGHQHTGQKVSDPGFFGRTVNKPCDRATKRVLELWEAVQHSELKQMEELARRQDKLQADQAGLERERAQFERRQGRRQGG